MPRSPDYPCEKCTKGYIYLVKEARTEECSCCHGMWRDCKQCYPKEERDDD